MAHERLSIEFDKKTGGYILLGLGNEYYLSLTQMVGSMTYTFDFMLSSPGGFDRDRNLWSHVYPGKSHSFEAWLARIWNALKILAIDRQ